MRRLLLTIYGDWKRLVVAFGVLVMATAAFGYGWAQSAVASSVDGDCGNVTPDPSFESAALTGWSSWQGTLSQAPLAAAPDGSYVARAAQAVGNEYSLELDPAVATSAAGVTWYASGYVEAASPSAVGKTVWYTIRERNSSGETVKRTSASATLSASFQHLSVQATALASGDRLDIYIIQENAEPADAFYADAVTLSESPPSSCSSQGPPPSADTFGKTTIGADSDHFTADTKRANEFSLGVEGTVSELTVYLQPTLTTGEESLEGIIYTDAGGVPGSLIATSSPIVFSSSDAAGWYELSFPAPPTLAPGNYWLATITGGTSYVAGFRYDPVPGSRDGNENAYSSGPSAGFGSHWQDGDQMSIYATFQTSAISPPPTPPPAPEPAPEPPQPPAPEPTPSPAPEPTPPPGSSCWSSLLPSSGLPFCLVGQSAPSPMNQPLPANPVVDPNSSGIVANLNSGPHDAVFSEFGTTVQDTANASTTVTLHCTEPWGTCSLEGKRLAVNPSWRPSWGSDNGMVVVDRSARKVYDFWRVATTASGTISTASGTLSTAWGGVTSLNGNGQNPGATGSNLSHLFGMVRMFEMANAPSSPATAIQHALHFSSSYTCSSYRYPALKSDGHSSGYCIPEGARVFLDSSADCSKVTPAGSEAVCYALQRYGAYATDTGGSPLTMGFEGDGNKDVPSVYSNAGFTSDYYNMSNIPWSHLHVAAGCQCRET